MPAKALPSPTRGGASVTRQMMPKASASRPQETKRSRIGMGLMFEPPAGGRWGTDIDREYREGYILPRLDAGFGTADQEVHMAQGTALPRFDLPTSGGGRLTGDALNGHEAVLYFYPKDDTPGCTIEGKEFTDLYPQFKERGVAVSGVSPDSERSHDTFIRKCALGIPLVSDPDHVLIDALGLWVDKTYMGRTYKGVERSTFIVGPDGTVVREWRNVKAPGHAAEVLEAVAGEA